MYVFFFQAEDGIRDAQESRGLGDVYKRQSQSSGSQAFTPGSDVTADAAGTGGRWGAWGTARRCLLYTSDAADDLLCVDLGGRRIIKKKTIY